MGIDGSQISSSRRRDTTSSSSNRITKKTTPQSREIEEKSLALAIGLNLVLPGAGYAYMGRWLLAIVGLSLFFGIFFFMGILFWTSTWLGLAIIMTVDMIILNNKHKNIVTAATTMKCPQCAELIKNEAIVCRFCGYKF